MELEGRHAVITGAAGGIGSALARRFAEDGATVTLADRDLAGAQAVAEEAGGAAIEVDVADPESIGTLVAGATEANGPIDLFWSNAGIAGPMGGPDVTDSDWQQIWEINLMSHVWATRAVLPEMLERGEGYLVSTASAAGLTTQVSAAPYSVTKHAAVAFAEWLAITYGDRGIRVSCLCPMGVNTNMLNAGAGDDGVTAGDVVRAAGMVVEPEQVADDVVAALREERFLVLPHPEVLTFFQRKGSDYDRWIAGMRRLQAAVTGAA